MWSTPLLALLPGPLWPGVVVPIKVPSMGQKEIFNYLMVQTNEWLLVLCSNTWNNITTCKQMSNV